MKNELGPYRTSANLEVRKPTLRERFREWRRVRRLRTCNGCLEKFDKDEVVYGAIEINKMFGFLIAYLTQYQYHCIAPQENKE